MWLCLLWRHRHGPGAGTITVTGDTVATSGQDSPGVYATGAISVSDAAISATGVTLTIAQASAVACFPCPSGIAVDSANVLYVADSSLNTVSKVTSTGVVSPLAGAKGTAGSADGTGPGTLFNQPNALAVTAAGVVYVADPANATVRQITSAGTVATVALSPANLSQ